MTTDKYIISPKLRNELEGFGKGYDKALEDVEKVIDELKDKKVVASNNLVFYPYHQCIQIDNFVGELKHQLKQFEEK